MLESRYLNIIFCIVIILGLVKELRNPKVAKLERESFESKHVTEKQQWFEFQTLKITV